MHIQISLQDGVPIYRQIVNQVKYMVASGQLMAEQELPPIRVLAMQLQVTPNTVVKAYSDLEAEGTIYKRRGAGTFVASLPSTLTRKEQRRIVNDRADSLLTDAQQLNFSLTEVIELLRKRWAVLQKKSPQEKAHVSADR